MANEQLSDAVNKLYLQLSLTTYGYAFTARSSAKLIAAKFEGFKEVELDFRDVESIGQSFADEMFRVWPLRNPATKLIPVNMNENVIKMLKHVLSRKDLPQAPSMQR
jgi:hypothetical protein